MFYTCEFDFPSLLCFDTCKFDFPPFKLFWYLKILFPSPLSQNAGMFRHLQNSSCFCSVLEWYACWQVDLSISSNGGAGGHITFVPLLPQANRVNAQNLNCIVTNMKRWNKSLPTFKSCCAQAIGSFRSRCDFFAPTLITRSAEKAHFISWSQHEFQRSKNVG